MSRTRRIPTGAKIAPVLGSATPADAKTVNGRAILDGLITEKAFQQQVIDYARSRQWMAYHSYRSTKSEYGYPDLTLIRGERLIYAELKTERGKLSAAQQHWLVALLLVAEHALNVSVFLWRPSSWPMIERMLA